MEDLGLTVSTIERLTTILSSKSIQELSTYLPPDSPSLKELQNLLQLVESYNIQDWIEFDASVMRGLAYYTGVVFEAFDRRGELRAIAGGGRYDKLLETFGGDPTPAAGFGFGDAVIVELLKDRNLLPNFDETGVEFVVFAMKTEHYSVALDVAGKLRASGKKVDVVLQEKKAKWVFKHADRIKAKHVVIVAPDELEREEVSVKNMQGGKQISVKIDQLQDWDWDTACQE